MKKVLCSIAALCILLSGCSASGITETYLTVANAAEAVITPANGDTQAPVITGAKNIVVYEGDPFDPLADIIVTDNADASPSLRYTTEADEQAPVGEYPLTYTAADAAGNTTSTTVTVTILEKQEGFTSIDTIVQRADALLAQILPENGSAEDNVRAIYQWANTGIVYTGSSEKNDFYQGAWYAMTTRTGDCWNYYSVCKLFFERLGIPNIDVVKVQQSEKDSHHFWSLVSVDGGESYYHFDATPRVGGGDFCLITDAALNAYSDAHNGSHNRDTSLYPATPDEPLR